MTPKNKLTLRKSTTKKTIDSSNHHLELSKNKKYSDSEIVTIMSEIINVSQEQIIENIFLFQNINNYIFNALFYLSKIKTQQGIISAIHSLEFVYNFNKGINDYANLDKNDEKDCQKTKDED